jgi:SnoaL-like domain
LPIASPNAKNKPSVGLFRVVAMSLSTVTRCLTTYLAAWNEHDDAKLRVLVDASLTKDVEFTDPNYKIVGIDAFIAQVREVRAKEGRARLTPTSGVDLHHDRARYSWALVREDGSRIEGFDAVAFDLEAGKIRRIDGFFGPLPALGKSHTS